MDFLLKCVKDKSDEPEIDAYSGSMFDGMGLNNHKGRLFKDELQIPSKKMFEKTQHALSKGFKDLCVPSNAATIE